MLQIVSIPYAYIKQYFMRHFQYMSFDNGEEVKCLKFIKYMLKS